jgi:hypothetical protein
MEDRSPYPTTATELVARFGTTPERRKLLCGLLAYRRALTKFGLREGFQWFDGSFVEDSERKRGRPPADLDVVTFAPVLSSHATNEQLIDALREHAPLFISREVRAAYHCDAYLVDTGMSPARIVASASYWISLFGRQRGKPCWKGMLQLDLIDDFDLLEKLEAVDDSKHRTS